MDHKVNSKEILGLTRITKKRLLALCKKDKLYQTPELNDVLYLHYQGLDCIECLEDYTELKCLWLECNAISEIQGLNKQTKLKCLFLQSNLIKKIENLDYCKELDTLNLSQNHIRKIENCGFEVLPVLNTLNLASNYLKDCESLKELENCKNLSVLDISNNRIDDILVVKIFSQMPELKVLVLQGNPVVSKIPQYRKTLILECKQLTYLDSRPVFPKDRACAEAWKRGGYAEERKENELWNRRERKKIRDSVNATIHLRNKNRKREEQISLIPSSDSEDDTKPQKKNIKVDFDSEVEMDDVWEEVSDEQNSNTYLFSQNEGQTNENGKVEEFNDGIIKAGDVIEEQKIGEQHCIVKMKQIELETEKDIREYRACYSQANFKEVEADMIQEQCEKENKIPKMILKDFSNNKEFKELERNSLEVNLEEAENIQLKETTCESDKNSQRNYEITIEAIKQISRSLDSSESLSQGVIKEYESGEGNNADSYELFKELEEKMNVFSDEVKGDQKSCQFEKNKKEKPVQKIEEECLRVNEKLKTDFEELSSNMCSFLNELEIEQPEKELVKEALFCKEKAAKDSSFKSWDREGDDKKLKSKFNCSLTDRSDKETEMKEGENNSEKKEEEVNLAGGMMNDRNKDGLPREVEKLANSFKADNYVELETERPERDDKNNLQNVAIDIGSLTRKSNEALKSLERESEELKKLLQQLENRNEELFKERTEKERTEKERTEKKQTEKEETEKERTEKEQAERGQTEEEQTESDQTEEEYESGQGFKDNLKHKEITKDDIQKINLDYKCSQNMQAIKESITTNPDDVLHLVEEIVEGILQSFGNTAVKQTSPELSQSNKDVKPKDNSKTIPEVIASFNHLFNKITKCPLENPDKGLLLKELSQKYNLKQFNNDTLEKMNVQLEEIKQNKHKKVIRMVDRVYAQKDRYNDTLELSDNKLMVRNKKTKELEELPKPWRYGTTSDSEDGYDTALSEENEPRKAKFKSVKPKVHHSSEDVVAKALNENKQIFWKYESGESSDEFFSLDGHETKANLNKIDKNLFKDLNFDLVNLTQPDDNHIVQCSRSYEELKHCSSLNREEKCLTEQENKLLENMAKRNRENLSAESKKTFFCMDRNPNKQLETFSEKQTTKLYVRDILEREENKETEYEEMSEEIFQLTKQPSEEGKNKMENNFDVENKAAYTKIFKSQDNYEISNNEFNEFGDKQNAETFVQPAQNSAKLETSECNLEIISDSDEIMNTIAVNSEFRI